MFLLHMQEGGPLGLEKPPPRREDLPLLKAGGAVDAAVAAFLRIIAYPCGQLLDAQLPDIDFHLNSPPCKRYYNRVYQFCQQFIFMFDI